MAACSIHSLDNITINVQSNEKPVARPLVVRLKEDRQ
jgi:hypothetical protein